jgi:hypothetical protein
MYFFDGYTYWFLKYFTTKGTYSKETKIKKDILKHRVTRFHSDHW